MIDWRKQTNKKRHQVFGIGVKWLKLYLWSAEGCQSPAAFPLQIQSSQRSAAWAAPEVWLCVLEVRAASHRFIFICFLKFHSGEACVAGFSSRKSRDSRCEQRDGAGYVQELAQSLTFLTCRYCDSRCDVVLQGMISGELQVVWEACPYTMTFLPVSPQSNNA